MDLTLETLLGGVSLVRGDHLDEAEASRLFGVRVTHNVALLDLAILIEQTCDLLLGEARVNAGHEKVGTWVAGTRIVGVLVLAGASAAASSSRLRWWTTKKMSAKALHLGSNRGSLPAVTSVGRGTAGANVLHVTTVGARRPAAVPVVATRLVYALC